MRVVAWLCEASPFYQYASIPHPAPEGRGQSWRYPGKGRTRGVSPDIGPWGIYTRGGYTPVGTSPRGWGRWGGGKKPPPLSLLSICQHPPPRPARRASSPAPGGGGSRGDTPGRIPMRWTVGTSPRGWGRWGGGIPPLPGQSSTRGARRTPLRISRMQGDMVQWFSAQRSPSQQKNPIKGGIFL